ncbi:Uncharacterised protein [Mycoplasmoides pneumoniae]|uniref:Uncharacterized protein n=1 Tax=Mycoplasmoides pneumoniae TaxID=2104 RepID=A0AB38W8R6_MYCPM|nr:Uncharacterised protein [Mycoplasmoides pneumoniae]
MHTLEKISSWLKGNPYLNKIVSSSFLNLFKKKGGIA